MCVRRESKEEMNKVPFSFKGQGNNYIIDYKVRSYDSFSNTRVLKYSLTSMLY